MSLSIHSRCIKITSYRGSLKILSTSEIFKEASDDGTRLNYDEHNVAIAVSLRDFLGSFRQSEKCPFRGTSPFTVFSRTRATFSRHQPDGDLFQVCPLRMYDGDDDHLSR